MSFRVDGSGCGERGAGHGYAVGNHCGHEEGEEEETRAEQVARALIGRAAVEGESAECECGRQRHALVGERARRDATWHDTKTKETRCRWDGC